MKRFLASGMIAALLAALMVLPAAAQSTAPTIRAEDGDPAVRQGDILRVSGSSLSPTATVDSATLIAFNTDGSETRVPVPSSVIGRRPTDGATFYLYNNAGTLDGRLLLGCEFGDPAFNGCPHPLVAKLVLEVTAGDTTLPRSNALLVDYGPPVLVRYALTKRDQIDVVFNEPVRISDPRSAGVRQPDSPGDWLIGDGTRYQVTAVEGGFVAGGPDTRRVDCGDGVTKGCRRYLKVSPPIAEDETPLVSYRPSRVGVSRGVYEDFAGNILCGGCRDQILLDNLRPAAPNIDTVAGQAPNGDQEILTNAPDPVIVELSNLTAGHEITLQFGTLAQVFTVPDGTTEFSVLRREFSFDDDQIDRVLSVNAVADDTSGNRSNDPDKDPPREDGDHSARVHLDRKAPEILGATLGTSSGQVLVSLLEEIIPAGDEGSWSVDGTPVNASGSGATRTLSISRRVPANAQIGWEPDAPTPVDSGTYTDRAGNPLIPQVIVIEDLPTLGEPVITAFPPLSGSSQVTVSGTIQGLVPDEASVDVLAVPSDRPNDTPSLVGTTGSIAGPEWSATVTLDEGEYLLFPRLKNTRDSRTSEGRRVLAEVDQTAPAVTITQPADRPLEGLPLLEEEGEPPGEYVVRFTVEEKNFDRAIVSAVYSAAGCADETAQAHRSGEADGVPTYEATFLLRKACDGTVVFTAEAVDRVALTGRDSANPLTILGDAIGAETLRFDPHQTANTSIVINLSDDVTGSTLPTDWIADDGITPETTDDQDRRSVGSRLSGARSATTNWVTGFPNQPDRNARPFVSLSPLVGQTRLEGTDGQRVIVNARRVTDLDQPNLDEPRNVPSGPVRVHTTEAGDGSRDDVPASTVPSLRVIASTHPSADPNYYRVSRTAASGFAQMPSESPVVEGRVPAGESSFSFDVPLLANAINEFRIEVLDPAGNQSVPEFRTLEIVEDSRGPEISSLAAPFDPANRDVAIAFTLAQPARDLQLQYRETSTDPWVPIGIDPSRTDDGMVDDRKPIRWRLPAGVGALGGVAIRARAHDALENSGAWQQTSLDLFAKLTAARVVDLRTVAIRTNEPVTTTQRAAAGFTIPNGPGVRSTSVQGEEILLHLNDELDGSETEVRYSGSGGWQTTDRRPLQSGTLALVVNILFPVTDLVAGPNNIGGAVLSFIDERNDPSVVMGYEISRDGDVVATLDRAGRILSEADLTDGTHTYAVQVLSADGRSPSVTTTVALGRGPLADHAAGGSGHPVGSAVVEDCPYPAAPNVDPSGGAVVSCDGRAALLVPADAVASPAYGRIIRRQSQPEGGFAAYGDAYQLVMVDAQTLQPIDALSRYSELSYRALRQELASHVAERATVLRLRDAAGGGTSDEGAPRVGAESVAVQVLTVGTFDLVQADGVTIRVFGPDPAIASDRFATAAGLSQTQFRRAGAAVLARADDYPDALASATVAGLVGGPVLLTRTGSVPTTTVLELQRLGVQDIVLVGGTVAISEDVAGQLRDLGFGITRLAGETRFHTAAEVARQVGAIERTAFVATGNNFADALAASAPAGALGWPILLTQPDQLTDVTLSAIQELGITSVTMVGGTAAVSEGVERALEAAGVEVTRAAGPSRYETAVELARQMTTTGRLGTTRALFASGEGDGITSPDALAAGPVGARLRAPLLLTPRTFLAESTGAFVRDGMPDLRGGIIAGGSTAVAPEARNSIDQAS